MGWFVPGRHFPGDFNLGEPGEVSGTFRENESGPGEEAQKGGLEMKVEIPTKFEFSFSPGSPLIEAIVDSLIEKGLTVPIRRAPFTMDELEKETRLQRSALYRLIEDGSFERIEGTRKILVTAESVLKWQGWGRIR